MTVRNIHINDDLLVKFLLGEISNEEILQVDAWLNESDENQKYLDELELTWIESGKMELKPVAIDKPLAWDKLSDRIDKFDSEKEKGRIIDLRKRALRFTANVAAVLIVAIGLFKIIQTNFSNQVLVADKSAAVNTVLADGSEIVLNSNSTLTYPKKFRGKVREVKLQGEAFFKVESNPQKPFIIDAGIGKVEVLGTHFNVNAADKGIVEVTVTEGTVKLFNVDSLTLDTNSVILKAGQKGIISQLFKIPAKIISNKPDALFWVNKTLIFDGTELSKVIHLLEKNYHISINVTNPSLYNCQLTSTFQNSTADEILEVIAFTFNIKLKKENNIYILQGESCESN